MADEVARLRRAVAALKDPASLQELPAKHAEVWSALAAAEQTAARDDAAEYMAGLIGEMLKCTPTVEHSATWTEARALLRRIDGGSDDG